MTIREYYKEKLKDVNVPAPSSGDVPGNSGQVHSETIVGVAVIIAVCLVLIFIFKKFHLIKKINQERENMNKKQKNVLIFLVPGIIFVVALGIASLVGNDYTTTTTPDAANWVRTWPVWAIALTVVVIFEYRMLKD
ncbi:MAG: hypothetical protein A2655_03570 [Candidatus Yanofskybacteria bacterium RIFCSPHIGHO2_01_FULL_43_42]|uniref:Uncharacterized protein n=1 Tax=Candidatus Collierbacteria bacterium RIFCSPHIGHO2_02_FULL_49_10 TaxID=1817723 RepID=A0A1F5EVV3_9BACT|nr:MAG: hypothetical protein A3D09_02175 [Candidatus Collierbacteria bacterium RIFCSPHIGHO2_02_FULL_49_10]OGN03248.1 MAG: hypothetical protein A2655_03570 [Candidatus Yanofskybacteria bacterium RIFCSPHIGHO2_01_FULL_43_42]